MTEVDFASEALLLEHLTPLAQKFDLGILTEEQTDNRSRLTKPYFFAIDPLDGTLPYTKGEPGYCVSIGLVDRSGSARMGVIYDPDQDNLYHAVRGQGAFKNGKTWNPKGSIQSPVRFILDQSALGNPEFLELQVQIKEQVSKQGLQWGEDISCGGAAMNAIWCLEHAPACYVKTPKKKLGGGSIWDFAASSCILTEAGAQVHAFNGNPLHLNDPKSTFMNQQGCLMASDLDLFQLVQQCISSS